MDELFGVGSEDFRQAEWLAKMMNDEWRYDHTAKRWHHWDGFRWAPDDVGKVYHTVARLARKWIADGSTGELLKALVRLLSFKAQKPALEALATFPGYGTNGDDWDSDPTTLGVKNGIVDLTTNKLIARPTSDNLVSKTTGTAFVPIGEFAEGYDRAPEFMRVIDEWMSGDESMTSFLLLWFGASMFGFSPEQRFLLMTGIGRNGKGALKHSVMHAVGDYGAQFDSNLYMRSKLGAARSDGARADLMALKGKRITFFSDPEASRFNEEMLKAHTGGDRITARALYSNNVQSWDPTHSITFLVNKEPELDDLGPSMAARVMVADFREQFDGDKEDKELYDKLKSEKEGILAILCWAAAAWYTSWSSHKGGIIIPERVKEQSKRFMERNDPVAHFINEACVTGEGIMGQGKLLYDAYTDWHNGSGREDDFLSSNRFAQELDRKGYKSTRRSSGIFWRGVKPMGAMDLAERGDDDDDDDETGGFAAPA